MRAWEIIDISYPDLVRDWTFDPAAALVIVVLAATWLLLVRRHPGWARTRTIAAVGALAAAVVATQSGVATHDTDSLTAHVLQHVLLGMLLPLLVALAAPVTLVLQSAHPSTRRVVRRWLRHPLVAVISHPLVGFVAFAASLVVLTFSPLLDVAARSDGVHLLVHVHLVLVGALFVWPLVGVDPMPERPGHGARLLIVFASVPFHAFVGVALLSATTTMFDAYPSLDDQRRAAGLLWGAGELFTLAVAAVVFVDWFRAEQRAGRRHDRQMESSG
ncbi:cytochrome c oxidase assembly protein [Actinospongicola halichondriae]|uniref:cytochrome c oxidase assembly protein n=1 Tax=Actinospongicola halichondriae TaxID=3236844 RepID=UPI003D445A97